MPNGGASEEYFRDLDEYFAPVAETLLAFADRHALLLEKYYHEAPSWGLCFSHPAGGDAKIEVSRKTEELLAVGGCWWVDDYDSFSRSIKDLKATHCSRIDRDVELALEASLKTILSWRPGDWSQVVTGYESIWRPVWNKEEFQALSGRWPKPK